MVLSQVQLDKDKETLRLYSLLSSWQQGLILGKETALTLFYKDSKNSGSLRELKVHVPHNDSCGVKARPAHSV